MNEAKTDTWVDSTVKMGDDLVKTGRNVYLAGLGAVATAGEEVRSVYDRFVSKGEEFEKSQDNLFNKAKDVGRKVENRVQETVSATLNRAGVPSRDEIHTLVHRVEELTQKVDKLAASK